MFIYYLLGISILLGLTFVIFKVMLAPSVQKIEGESVDDWLRRSNKNLAKSMVILLVAVSMACALMICLCNAVMNLN